MADLDLFVVEARVEIVPVTTGQARVARDVYRRFGRGNHPAGFSIGDCFAFALAKERDQPLRFKGADFARTGIHPGDVIARHLLGARARMRASDLTTRRSS